MKISTKGRYGLSVMIVLAKNYGGAPVSLKRIAQEQDLSEYYLEQLAPLLRNAGLIQSIRGPHGGYRLNKPAEDITACDIIRVLEGPITPVEGIEDESPEKKHLWKQIRDAVKNVLETTTLEDLVNYKDHDANEPYMFHI